MINVLCLYISTFRIMCAVGNMATFCSFLISCSPGILLKYCVSGFEMVPAAPVVTTSTFFIKRVRKIAKRCY